MKAAGLASPAADRRAWSEIALKYGAYVALLALLLVNSIITPNFFNINVLWNIVIQSATTLLCSLGMTILISGGGINLALGAIMAVSSCTTAFILQQSESIMLSFGAVILVSLLCGFLLGWVIAVFHIQPMIATLAAATLLRGVAMLFPNTGLIAVRNRAFTDFSIYRFFGIFPIQILIIAAAVFFVYVLMRKMSFGRYVEAIGDNRSASLFAGIKIIYITILMYMFSSFLGGMAGLLETSRLAASNAVDIGATIEMDAVASTVIGGTPLTGGSPRIFGTMIGVFIMQLITITVNMNNIIYEYSLIIKAIIILAAVLIQKIGRKQ